MNNSNECSTRSRSRERISTKSAYRARAHRHPSNCCKRLLRLARLAAVCSIVLLLVACAGDTHLTFLDPQGPIAHQQRWHFFWVLAVLIVMVAGPIFILLPFWAWRYRYGNKSTTYKPNWEFSRILEITAWGGPIIIVAILAYFVWHDAHKLDPYKPLTSVQAPLQVEVIGYDWKWLFIYPEQGIASIGTLALPVGRPLSLHMTSATVMQSFFIPALGSQIYAMGGMVSQLNLEASEPGNSLGENTMYNGDGFHQQKFTAQAMVPADFDAWVTRVRSDGMPLDAHVLQLIAMQGTPADLIKALPKSSSTDGNLYFTGVGKALFPNIVKATMDGNPTLPASAFDPNAAALNMPHADNASRERKP